MLVGDVRRARRAGQRSLPFLEVVGRQPAVRLGDEGLEVAPGHPRRAPQARPLFEAQRAHARTHRDAELIGERRRADPQQEKRRGDRQRVAAPDEHGDRHRGRGDRARNHLHREAPQAAAPDQPGRPRRGGGGGLPLEQPPLRDDQPHERQRDGVEGIEGVEREQRQAEEDLRHRRRGVVAQVGEEHREATATGPGR